MRREGNVYLVGFMGSGKTSVGRLLADMTGMGFVDIDLMIENDRGMTRYLRTAGSRLFVNWRVRQLDT